MPITTVFYIGATGYVGGPVLANLVKAHPELKVTALVRNPAHVGAFKSLGVQVIQGSFSDLDVIISNARTADITVNTGDSDDVPLTEAILAGQKARYVEDKKAKPILLHTSGVAIFADDRKAGKHDPNSKVWNDSDENDIRAINDKMLHGIIDSRILRASEEGYTISYIVAPGAVVGPTTGPVPAGSLFYRFIMEVAVGINKVAYVGEGSNVFYMVRLDDLADFFGILFEHILSGKDADASPYSRYYVAANNPIDWKHIATVVGATLKRMGRLGNLEDGPPQSISASILQPPADVFMGDSQNVRTVRGKALGWRPRLVELEDSAEEGIKFALERLKK